MTALARTISSLLNSDGLETMIMDPTRSELRIALGVNSSSILLTRNHEKGVKDINVVKRDKRNHGKRGGSERAVSISRR
jgi:hypothetical protein